jgi:lysozyme
LSAGDVIRQHKGKLTGTAAAIALTSALIVHWEGEKLVVSHNWFDPPDVYDVCNGITNKDMPSLKIGQRFTHEQCDDMRRMKLPNYINPLKKCINGFERMPVARQAALGSLSWNIGPRGVCKSEAVRNFNAGTIEAGCRALGNFIKANGVVLKGLWNRRHDSNWGEIAWCMEND